MGKPEFLGNTPVPPFERAMESRRFRIAQQVAHFRNGKSAVGEISTSGFAPG